MTAGATIGVDVGGTFLKAVRLGSDRTVERRLSRPTPSTGAGVVEAIVEAIDEIGPGTAVGVGLAGLVDHEHGTLLWGPHLPFPGLEVGPEVAAASRLPVVVDNDANLAVVAESTIGAAEGRRHVVLVTLGTGIGVGVRFDGRLLRGRGHAGEAGHIVVAPSSTTRCACGRRGCWEAQVSGSALDASARSLLGDEAKAADLVAAARTGDPGAAEILDEAGERLADGLEILLLVLDPEVIVVGGAVAAAGPLLLEPARRRLAGTEGAAHRGVTDVVEGRLGADAGAIGAALAAAGEC